MSTHLPSMYKEPKVRTINDAMLLFSLGTKSLAKTCSLLLQQPIFLRVRNLKYQHTKVSSPYKLMLY